MTGRSKLLYLSDWIPDIQFSESNNFLLVAGPCLVESQELTMVVAEHIAGLSRKYEIPFVFKASYRKANRSRLDSFTGIGDEKALEILGEVKREFGVPVITDIHSSEEAYMASEFVDILQIPAFLCRQTELLLAAAKTGKTVSIKKGQFLSPSAIKFAIEKIISTGNKKVMVTERGTTFGYHDLIVDFRGIPEMQSFGVPVVLDITHSLQQPNQESGISGGKPELIEIIARAGIAVGADGIFIETHPEPSEALSDSSNMLKLNLLDELLKKLIKLREIVIKM